MKSRYWTFVEESEDATTVRAVRENLTRALSALGVDRFALVTHARPDHIGSLAVLVHNWSNEAIEHLWGDFVGESLNPLFEGVEQSDGILSWSSATWLGTLKKDQRAWVARLRELVKGNGASRLVRSTVVNASCSITTHAPADAERVRVCLRIANYAFQQIQFLQRPQLSEAERLTVREHEVMYRAAIFGERPSLVSRRLGVKVSTIRTLRQKAYGRLDAESPEQATWRMIETGQLFRGGRKGKPRTW